MEEQKRAEKFLARTKIADTSAAEKKRGFVKIRNARDKQIALMGFF
jgi:hypothetical protein